MMLCMPQAQPNKAMRRAACIPANPAARIVDCQNGSIFIEKRV
ncbi:hypothetical protein ASZ90_009274 [hydrocarbon metagenome]|uniref:Uncharacterized protein n=1 Tax=hydrocarbon metagenome TaxID=938273 RepID=A0A0W8FJY2_9ZZZZ